MLVVESPPRVPTLILTPRFTEDAQALWRGAISLGWRVERLWSWRVPEQLLQVKEPVLHVDGLFGPTLAEQFGLRLPEPPMDWLPRLAMSHRKREISLTTLGAVRRLPGAAFVKPPNDKSFKASVYNPTELPSEYDDEMEVLVSEVVEWEKEFRCFVLDRECRATSVYLRNGELQRALGFAASHSELAEAREFLDTVLHDSAVELPRATVIDVGVIRGSGWAVIEQNCAWGSGIYGCDPAGVLQVLQHAAVSESH